MTDIRKKISGVTFQVRACGVLHRDDEVLVCQEDDGSFTLTGGAAKVGENSQEAVVREFLEETNLHVKINRILGIIENFFEKNECKYHEIVFVYDLRLEKDKEQILRCEEKINVRWEKASKITRLKPEALNEMILPIFSEVQHVILKY